MVKRLTSTVLVCMFAAGLSAPALAFTVIPTGARSSVTVADRSGDVIIAGDGVPSWVKKSRRSRAADLTNLKVSANAKSDRVRAVFELVDLQKSRVQKKGRALYRGTYLRRWAVSLFYTNPENSEDHFWLSFGYEESHNGRENVLDKPRVFYQVGDSAKGCQDGTVKFDLAQDRVLVSMPITCFGIDGIRGKDLEMLGLSSTLGLGRDDVYRDYGSDGTKFSKSTFVLPD